MVGVICIISAVGFFIYSAIDRLNDSIQELIKILKKK